jgi:hypothetical protein
MRNPKNNHLEDHNGPVSLLVHNPDRTSREAVLLSDLLK